MCDCQQGRQICLGFGNLFQLEEGLPVGALGAAGHQMTNMTLHESGTQASPSLLRALSAKVC